MGAEMTLYAVRDCHGRWFKKRGNSSNRSWWADDFKDARVWTNPGPAKSQVTFFVADSHSFGEPPPDLVELRVSEVVVVAGEPAKARARIAAKRALEDRSRLMKAEAKVAAASREVLELKKKLKL